MTYQLGIDFGTTFTASALCRKNPGIPPIAEVIQLASRSVTAASVFFLDAEGNLHFGEAAERRAAVQPERALREIKRRIGDHTPIDVAGEQYLAHDLAAKMVRWVIDQVTEREGEAPGQLAITHPVSWREHKKTLFYQALSSNGVADAMFITEPQAAAVSYAGTDRMPIGSTVAVYDLGGGTFDAAVVRKIDQGSFEVLGTPEGAAAIGGIDFDAAVFEYVRDTLGSALDDLDPTDPTVLTALTRLRRECVEAKEALSVDTETVIPVLLPNVRTQIRLVRAEFEDMIRPVLEDTVDMLERAIESTGLSATELTSVLLVGGSSRIPLVTQLVSERLGRPVSIDTDSRTTTAVGAALSVSESWPTPARSIGLSTLPARPVVDSTPLLPEQRIPAQRFRAMPIVITGVLAAAVLGVFTLGMAQVSDATASGTSPEQTPPPSATTTSAHPGASEAESAHSAGATGHAQQAEAKSSGQPTATQTSTTSSTEAPHLPLPSGLPLPSVTLTSDSARSLPPTTTQSPSSSTVPTTTVQPTTVTGAKTSAAATG